MKTKLLKKLRKEARKKNKNYSNQLKKAK
jgi:hypothetical protein